VHQLELYKNSLYSRGKDAMIKDFKLKILICFNSPIIKIWILLHQTPHMFLFLLSNWAIFVILEVIGGGLRILFEFHKQDTMCESSTSFEFFKCLLIGLSTLPSLWTLYNIVNLCSTLHYSNSVLIHRGCWMHLCVGVKKKCYGQWNCWIYLFLLSLVT